MTVETYKKYMETRPKQEIELAIQTLTQNIAVARADRKPHLQARINVCQELLGLNEKDKKKK